ncbi:MAG: sugar-binding protein [Planctomycetota bacterium]
MRLEMRFLVGVILVATLAGAEERPTYRCYRVGTPLRIDGKLEDAAWEALPRVTGFTLIDRGRGVYASEQTLVRAGWDDSGLYISFMCMEPEISRIKTQAKERDGRVWADDSIQVFLDIPRSRERSTLMRFILNTANVQCDEMGGDFGWNREWKSAVVVGDGFWSVEIGIPFSQLGATPKTGDAWGGNFTRKECGSEDAQFSAWSYTAGTFIAPKLLGDFVFVGSPAGPQEAVVEEERLNGGYLAWLQGEVEKARVGMTAAMKEVEGLLKDAKDAGAWRARFEGVAGRYETALSRFEGAAVSLETCVREGPLIGAAASEYEQMEAEFQVQLLLAE